MKRAILMPVLAIATTMAGVNAFADADAQYRAGADFARQVQGQGESSLKNFNPSASIPNYTASPGEKKYYGGVTATGDGALKADGTTGWTTNEATKAVTDSFVNNPKEPISPDAPFIKASQDVQSRADTIIGKTGQTQCEAQNISRSEFTNYTCERDLLVEQACTRTASITGDWKETTETKTYTITSFNFSRSGKQIVFSFTSPEAGMVNSASLNVTTQNYLWNSRANFMNTIFNLGWNATIGLTGATGLTLTKGQTVQGSSCSGNGSCTGAVDNIIYNDMASGKTRFTLTLIMQVKSRVWIPRVEWGESCPFSKSEGTLKKTECIEPGSTKTVVVEGKPYQVTQACWKYKDTYMTQAADNGTCKTYMNNPACTLASRTCAFTAEDGSGCLHEYATYSCETRTSGQVMICGGDTFCLDGDCERAQNGKNNDFAPVVSALAALAAAGKDVAAINSVDVRAFTGSAKFCKKFAAGFSNCCKDGGWGQDVGLARCSSEEKALGKAKENKLTVSIGEFCSKKVLGVCLEKKRSYCQFDSKLAQIVQQQGRNGQLHVGFGKASSPDCRGITQTELQQINFEALDFSNFFDDLQKNKKIPDNDTLTKRVREEIAAQLKNKQ
ncbi:type-F conjugative transfer system mating-pair stabilization protein TraN [Salmonella enterica subsp. salamae]|uniref:Type-F conjugative transfer system mating-pair stabilization protein TraN n=1 Tax=Salmonella enterica subsp. salamae TaxID=59202 RepID=A0A5Y3V2C2_SALER|nr:type-F conjugative transfer system mating-pair stabilization protein TraN [Salmonella enterica subsp. salamae]ECJ2879059.1 type-F conjugative transfer system mating-pair stabilization protein TraN [Salmonella enterica subsp. enterica serovar Pomona]EEO8345723.1 type-F conjugative transfer system mating-pair stabilization protein TraN [Salmonella enterica]ECG8516858.1 type-F conjugative transfer system mating-pair stabilization protein TraN [Salmonella enterica subsp. salamae]ECI3453147.1 typ